MIINEIDRSKPYLPLIQQQAKGQSPEVVQGEKFSDTLKELIDDTNTLQIQSADLTERTIKGEPVDLHDVMIAYEKAKTSFQLLMEIRNRFLDMYREISRMQT
ncbi:MAG: flagellar hook-basal body complex protein FliE [Ignavibacteriae bacterium]|nr:flagellar hook-basal body complex protein FliE [Ignavibacteriota bacterium]